MGHLAVYIPLKHFFVKKEAHRSHHSPDDGLIELQIGKGEAWSS